MDRNPRPSQILVLNTGSSSLKFAVVSVSESGGVDGETNTIHARGAAKGIGGAAALELKIKDSKLVTMEGTISNHEEAAQWVFERLQAATAREDSSLLDSVDAIGHRVVHGGDRFDVSTRIDDNVLEEIERLNELAPLHNPACLAVIRSAQARWGRSFPMVAVFDTAFHHRMPKRASTYALPMQLATRHRVRRYGFHGIAHASLAMGYAKFAGKPLHGSRLITVHLGSGCSVAAIQDGRSVDTSMGFTPLEGLVMGTRCGDLDAAVVAYLARQEDVSADEVERWLNERSGLLGVSGRSSDVRELLKAVDESQDSHASLAIDLFCYRARKYIGAYLAVLGGADAVIFGGGIGEHEPAIRARICEGMEWCGLVLDTDRNLAAVGEAACLSADGTRLPAHVIPVDEESSIASETARCLSGREIPAPN